MKNDLYDKAIRLLSHRAHARRELQRKLRRFGPADAVEEVLDRLVDLGFLNDSAFAVGRARFLRESNRWGNLRIRLDLKRLGLDAKMIDLAIRQLEDEYPEADGLHKAVLKWVKVRERPRTIADLKKLYEHCLRLGYSPEMVRRELAPDFDRVQDQESI